MKAHTIHFVVDTEQYAGNFERELCAYVTGHVGECGVGDKQAELYRKETKREPIEGVIDLPDEHGCHRPCRIWPTPGWFNHGMGGHFREGREKEALKDYRKEVFAYYSTQIRQAEGSAWAQADKERSTARYRKEIASAEAKTKVSKHHAYLSVAIHFEKAPASHDIELMKERARKFRPSFGSKPKITGFRIVEERTALKEQSA